MTDGVDKAVGDQVAVSRSVTHQQQSMSSSLAARVEVAIREELLVP